MAGEAAAAMPVFIAPMLAVTARALPPDEAGWTAEAKWDGMRASAYIRGGEVRLRSRTGRDITAVFPELMAITVPAGRHSLILDGEIVAVQDGRPDFARLQRRMHATRPAAGLVAAVPVTFVAFDLLYAGGRLLLGNPYRQRRALLDSLGLAVPGVAEVPPAFPGEGAALLEAAASRGLEGVVLKRPSSRYSSGRRSRDWMKIRLIRTADVVIGGWLPGSRGRLAGSVLAGTPGPAGLVFRGQVGSGLTDAAARDLTAVLERLEQAEPPFAGPLPTGLLRRAQWVRPVLRAEVAFAELTPAGRFRHPVWRGLRPSLTQAGP